MGPQVEKEGVEASAQPNGGEYTKTNPVATPDYLALYPRYILMCVCVCVCVCVNEQKEHTSSVTAIMVSMETYCLVRAFKVVEKQEYDHQYHS